jgi:hypothetical protein
MLQISSMRRCQAALHFTYFRTDYRLLTSELDGWHAQCTLYVCAKLDHLSARASAYESYRHFIPLSSDDKHFHETSHTPLAYMRTNPRFVPMS